MISKKMEEAINQQINAEVYSSSLYYAISAYFESLSLKGFARWMRVQAIEELTHVHKFFAYVNDRGGRVTLAAVEAPRNEWSSPLEAFEEVYAHECKVTSLINDLMSLAQSEKDFASQNFLQWFVGEQVEEEASADEAVQQLKLVDKTEGGLFLLDQEMGKRSFVMPVFLTGAF